MLSATNSSLVHRLSVQLSADFLHTSQTMFQLHHATLSSQRQRVSVDLVRTTELVGTLQASHTRQTARVQAVDERVVSLRHSQEAEVARLSAEVAQLRWELTLGQGKAQADMAREHKDSQAELDAVALDLTVGQQELAALTAEAVDVAAQQASVAHTLDELKLKLSVVDTKHKHQLGSLTTVQRQLHAERQRLATSKARSISREQARLVDVSQTII
jgi:chromosome segregation ATPase